MDTNEFRQKVQQVNRDFEAAVEAAEREREKELARLALAYADDARVTSVQSRSDTTPKSVKADRFAEQPARRKLKRGEIDELLSGVLEHNSGEVVTTLDMQEALQNEHPSIEFNRSTVYGALERRLEDGDLELVSEGGRGSGNQRSYRVKQEP